MNFPGPMTDDNTVNPGEEIQTMEDQQEATRVPSLQILIFKAAHRELAVPILEVKEILKPYTLTRIPNTPRFVLGVCNLRGEIIPIIDLKEKFLGETPEVTRRSRIIVVEHESHKFGLLVDEVKHVARVPEAEIEDPEKMDQEEWAANFYGFTLIEEQIVFILQTQNLLFETGQGQPA